MARKLDSSKEEHPQSRASGLGQDHPQVQVRAWLEWHQKNLMGRGRLALLRHIQKEGSISAAARAMGVSYRAAWRWIAAMNEAAQTPLVITATGGKGGGGAQLTDVGQGVLNAFELLEQRVEDFRQEINRELAGLF